jgi:uncharacterized membrane protein
MDMNKRKVLNFLWFALEVVGIFLVVQLIRLVIGTMDAFYSGLVLVVIASILFIAAFFIAKRKDKQLRKPEQIRL